VGGVVGQVGGIGRAVAEEGGVVLRDFAGRGVRVLEVCSGRDMSECGVFVDRDGLVGTYLRSGIRGRRLGDLYGLDRPGGSCQSLCCGSG